MVEVNLEVPAFEKLADCAAGGSALGRPSDIVTCHLTVEHGRDKELPCHCPHK